MNYSEEIIEKAKKMQEKGSPLTFEAICAVLDKAAKKEAKKNGNSAKWIQREKVAAMPVMSQAEMTDFNEKRTREQAKAAGLI